MPRREHLRAQSRSSSATVDRNWTRRKRGPRRLFLRMTGGCGGLARRARSHARSWVACQGSNNSPHNLYAQRLPHGLLTGMKITYRCRNGGKWRQRGTASWSDRYVAVLDLVMHPAFLHACGTRCWQHYARSAAIHDDQVSLASPKVSAEPEELPATVEQDTQAVDNRPKESLLLAAAKRRLEQAPETEEQKQMEEEEDIMKHVLQKQALKAVKELARVRSQSSYLLHAEPTLSPPFVR
eukprot:354782-Chlamydomonas_euryale.AAC.9